MISGKKFLFLQMVDIAAYPPICNAAECLALSGNHVTVINSPVVKSPLKAELAPGVIYREVCARTNVFMSKWNFLLYTAIAAKVALKQRPEVIYASDPLAALPALICRFLTGAKLIYHEHDSPSAPKKSTLLWRLRKLVIMRSWRIVFPSRKRARLALNHVSHKPEAVRVIWNVPRLAELPTLISKPPSPLILYYHGGISPERVPVALAQAVASFNGAVLLWLVGKDVPSAQGHLLTLTTTASSDGRHYVKSLGEVPTHRGLLEIAAQAHVGIALMPNQSPDLNMQSMAGASNKAFDYMAAGLPLIVSNHEDWVDIFVAGGYGISCDPSSVVSIRNSILTYLLDERKRSEMGTKCRGAIQSSWNYESLIRGLE